MSAVSQIDPHASAPPPITHPAPTRDSAWKYALEHEGWTTLLVLTDALSALAAVLIAIAVTDTPGVSRAEYLSLFVLPLAVPAMLHVRGVYRRRVRVALRALSPMLGAISVASHGCAHLGRRDLGRNQPGTADRLDLAADGPAAGRRALRARAGAPAGPHQGAGRQADADRRRRRRRRDDRPAPDRPARVRPAPGRLPRREPAVQRERARPRPHPGAAGAGRAVRARRGRGRAPRRARHLRLHLRPRPEPARPGAALRAARPGGLAGPAAVRVDERPRGARLGRQHARAGHPPARPEGLAVPRQVRDGQAAGAAGAADPLAGDGSRSRWP